MQRQEERILLGGWLLGFNKDDIEKFEECDFINYTAVFRLLKAGKSSLEIARQLNIPIPELAQMQSEYSYSFYMQIVEQWAKEKLFRKIANLAPKNGSTADIEKIRNEIDWLLSSRYIVKPSENLAELFGKEMIERADSKPINYGIPSLDRMTGGLKKTELTVIAARPSVGKSALALQIADYVQGKSNKVLFFPLEMSTIQTLERLCIRNNIADYKPLLNGRLGREKYAAAQDYINSIEKKGLLKIFEGQNNIDIIHTAIKQEKPQLVVIDQLTQLKANRMFSSVRERFAYMTNTLKAIAMKENISIILLYQVNRDAQNNEPTMANLKESGSIEEDADNVIIMHKINKDNLRRPTEWQTWETPININLAKHRAGKTGSFLISFVPEKLLFYEHTSKRC